MYLFGFGAGLELQIPTKLVFGFPGQRRQLGRLKGLVSVVRGGKLDSNLTTRTNGSSNVFPMYHVRPWT